MIKEFEIRGQKFEAWTPEENPMRFVSLLAECERINQLNPDLIRINRNTWVNKRDATPNDFKRAEQFRNEQ